MTDISDSPYIPSRRIAPRPRVEPLFEAHADALTDAMRRAAEPAPLAPLPDPEPPQPSHPSKQDDLASLKEWIDHLKYRDLKKAAKEITGSDDEAAAKLADQMATWADPTRGEAA